MVVSPYGPWKVLGPMLTVGDPPVFSLNSGSDGFLAKIAGKWRFCWHFGNRIVYTDKDGDTDPLTGWPIPLGGIGNPTGVLQGAHPYSGNNRDTPCLVERAGVFTIVSVSTPGLTGIAPYIGPAPNIGKVQIGQRRESTSPSPDPADWTGDDLEILIAPDPAAPWMGPFSKPAEPPEVGTLWEGGLNEFSVVWEPNEGPSGLWVMFFDGKNGLEEPDLEGQTDRHRLGRATSPDLTTWTFTPPPAADSWVWAATEEPLGWGNRHQPIHPCVTRLDSGRYVLAMLGGIMSAGVGQGNKTTAIGLWYSDPPNYGKKGTWYQDPENPIITKAMVGIPVEEFHGRQLNSPTFILDEATGFAYVEFTGGGFPNWTVGQNGSRYQLARAPLTSIRDLIVNSICTKLATITVANGYENNLSVESGGGGCQKPGAKKNPLALLPTVIVSAPEEAPVDTLSRHSYRLKHLQIELEAIPSNDGTTPIEDQIDDLVEDIERVILAEAEADPPLGITGVEDLIIGSHVKLPVEGEALDGARYSFIVKYRHDTADPRVYTG